MPWKIVEATLLEHLAFMVKFADGVTGKVRISPSHLYGVFECLKDPEVFAQLSIENGYVSWPGEVDLAPDSMYEAIRARGEWVLA